VACEVFVKIVGNKRQEGRNREQERDKKQGTRKRQETRNREQERFKKTTYKFK
jgi:hypothetical protein